MSSKRNLTGKPVVFGMFLFALVVSVGLWGYWELHTQPFRALTDQLGKSFPHSNPRVEGGKHGMHKQTPLVLRIVMRVDYDPILNEQEYQKQVSEILALAAQSGMLNKYEECEIHLYFQPAEQKPEVRSIKIPDADFPKFGQ